MSNGQVEQAIAQANKQIMADGITATPKEVILLAATGVLLEITKQQRESANEVRKLMEGVPVTVSDMRAGVASVSLAVEGLQAALGRTRICPYSDVINQARKPSRRRHIGVLAVSIPVGAGFIAWVVEQIGKLLK